MKLTRENIKDLIYAITIVVGVLLFLRDEAKDDAILEVELKQLIRNDEKREDYWNNQLEFNGTVNEFIRNSIRSGSSEEEEGD
jgi:hypothetical protein